MKWTRWGNCYFIPRILIICQIRFGNVCVFQNEIWAETKYMGFHISYYACRKGQVFNVSDWIICQVSSYKLCVIFLVKSTTCLKIKLNRLWQRAIARLNKVFHCHHFLCSNVSKAQYFAPRSQCALRKRAQCMIGVNDRLWHYCTWFVPSINTIQVLCNIMPQSTIYL